MILFSVQLLFNWKYFSPFTNFIFLLTYFIMKIHFKILVVKLGGGGSQCNEIF